MKAASSALAELLDGPPQRVLVHDGGPRARYATVGHPRGPVIAFELPGGAELPNAIVVEQLPAPGSRLDTGDVRPRRWFDPTVPAVAELQVRLGDDRPAPGVAEIGSGPGSTPEVDDWFAGLLVALRARGAHHEADRCWAELMPRLAKTTPLSATLLRHAWRGQASGPVRRLMACLARCVDPASAVRAVEALGATSGAAVLAGIGAGLAPSHPSCARLPHG